MARPSPSRFHRLMLGLVLVAFAQYALATEKYAILNIAKVVVVGRASEFDWSIRFTEWRLMWVATSEIEVRQVLKGPSRLKGEKVPFIFRCGACSLVTIPAPVHNDFKEEGLWFLAPYGSRWEAAGGPSADPGFRYMRDRTDFERAIREDSGRQP